MDMGFRENVMGPQPIGKIKQVPQDLLDTVAHLLDLLAAGRGIELAALAVEGAKDETLRLASAVKAGAYNDKAIIATARTNDHYWVKARMTGADVKPFILQFRLGLEGGKWVIWEVTNLTDAKSGWTK